ncbi:MAG: putative hydrophobic protein (TIGR00271 family) [Cryomorphaceae bacterium]|jgi:uncharacterized hydrophobic protein (TIGR00271 family)
MSVLLVIREDLFRDRLVDLGVRFAAAKERELYVVSQSSGSALPVVTKLEWVGEEIKTITITTTNPFRTIKDLVAELKPDMLLLNDANDHPEQHSKVINQAINEISCEVMIVRLGEGDHHGEKILVPCGGGRHSRVALRLAHKMAGLDTTAFFVEPDVDEVSESVGFAQLHRQLTRAKVPADEVRCEVVLDNDVFKGIRDEVQKNDYGLVLIGASGHSSVRRKLFGTVPDKLMRGEKGMSICVIRSAMPMGSLLRDKIERLLHLNVPQLNRDERVLLFGEVEEKSRWSFDFAVLIMLSTMIAALGLLSNSGAVVIGAMLVAPLMTPLLGGGLSLVQGNWPLWKRCQTAVLLGFFSALAIGALMGLVARLLDMPMTAQLAMRGEPSTLDLGIAFFSGVAASYCLARPKLSSALAGVAIAAALVPPIATTGICLVLGKFSVAQGAALLFGTNVVAIVVGAAFNFYLAGIRGRKKDSGELWSRRFLIALTLVMAGLIVPLTSVLIERVAGPVEVEEVLIEQAEQYGVTVKLVQRSSHLDGLPLIELTLESAQPVEHSVIKKLKRAVEKATGEEVHLRVRTILVSEL